MEEHIYKSRLYRILLNLVFGTAATAVVGLLVYSFFAPIYAVIAAVVTALLYVWLVIIDCFITIIVKEGKLIVVKGKKRQEFEIEKCSFRAETTTSSGDTSCYLTVIDPQGEEHDIDFELIGIGQFHSLLEDLGVIGDNAKVQKIETRRTM